jgi:hypothetical protein
MGPLRQFSTDSGTPPHCGTPIAQAGAADAEKRVRSIFAAGVEGHHVATICDPRFIPEQKKLLQK